MYMEAAEALWQEWMSNWSFYLGVLVFMLLANIAGYKIVSPLLNKGMNAIYRMFPRQRVYFQIANLVLFFLLLCYLVYVYYDLIANW